MKMHNTLAVMGLLVVAGLLGLAAKLCKPIAPIIAWALEPWEQQFEAMSVVYLMQYSVPVRNARLDAIETAMGTTAILELRSGPPPASCATAPSGTILAQFNLPSDWMAAASAGIKAKTGTWSGSAVGTGDVGHFRIYNGGSPSECGIQGTAGPTGSPTYDMGLDNINVAPGQTITVTSFQLTAGNA